MNEKVVCYAYYGQDDDQKIIYIEKKVLNHDDEKVVKYAKEYDNVTAWAESNGYNIVDVDKIIEDDYPHVKDLVLTMDDSEGRSR